MIVREPTPECYHCGEVYDNVGHTLAVYPAWEARRQNFLEMLNVKELTLVTLVQGMLVDETHWELVAEAFEAILLKKENAERQREMAGRQGRFRRRVHEEIAE